MEYARALLSSVDCRAVHYFYTLSHKGMILEKKFLNIKCVSLLCR
jgi:hypothetical protein